jgi:glycosyltransferase involved in cell wall biosynthesis
MRILLVSFSYSPSLTPRAFRWAAIVAHWTTSGHEVDVVCESSPGKPAVESLDGATLYRTGRISRAPLAAPGARSAPAAVPRAGAMRRLARWLWRTLYWPDYAFWWYPGAAKLARSLAARKQYDLMISTSVPFTAQLVGLAVRWTQPALRWVVDIGDPFSFGEAERANNAALYDWLNRRVEHAVFRQADAVSVTTVGTLQQYARQFPDQAGKLCVIPPLLPKLPDPSLEPRFPRDGRRRLVFVGTLYRDIRSPLPLLALFAGLQQTALAGQLELHFFGEASACREVFDPWQHWMGSLIHVHGLVSRNDAFAAMHEGDVLVNIGNNTSYQLPSKVVEYLAMGKPILNVVQSDQDSSLQFFSQHEGVLNILASEAASKPVIAQAAAFIGSAHALPVADRQSALLSHTIESVATAYQGL